MDKIKALGYIMIAVGFLLAVYYLVSLATDVSNSVEMAFSNAIDKLTEAIIRAIYISVLIWAGGVVVNTRKASEKRGDKGEGG